MLTAQGLANELHRLVERGLAARLDPAEIADALQNELDEIEVVTGTPVRSGLVATPESR